MSTQPRIKSHDLYDQGSNAKIEGTTKGDDIMTRFSTLDCHGREINIREFPQARFSECPFTIFMPEHYRKNKGCFCSNAKYRKMMVKEWGYTKSSFAKIPLID